MSRKITTDIYINEASEKHNNFYDYSLVDYTKGTDKISIICPKHGVFIQRAKDHIAGGGCPKCWNERNRGVVCGVGINDVGQQDIHLFTTWRGMLFRCYDKKYNKAYNDCEVCDEWKKLSSFKEWYDANYVEGWQLDKDILAIESKIYSPETCCFVPSEINMCIVGNGSNGVTFVKRAWQASFSQKYLGRFQTKEEAVKAYSYAKAKHIQELAIKYADVLPQRVFNALNQHALRLCGLNELADSIII